MGARVLTIPPPFRAKALSREDVERTRVELLDESHAAPDAGVLDNVRPLPRAERLRSAKRKAARLRSAELLTCAMKQAQVSNYDLGAMLDMQEHAVRDLKEGLRPFEVGHLELMSSELRGALLQLLALRFMHVRDDE